MSDCVILLKSLAWLLTPFSEGMVLAIIGDLTTCVVGSVEVLHQLNINTHPELLTQNLHFTKSFRQFNCPSWFENQLEVSFYTPPPHFPLARPCSWHHAWLHPPAIETFTVHLAWNLLPQMSMWHSPYLFQLFPKVIILVNHPPRMLP